MSKTVARSTKIVALILVVILSISVTEPVYAASAKKPATPKIISAKANETSVTISWSKVKRAKKYQVAKRTAQKTWVKYKTVKKSKKNQKKYTKAGKYKVVAKGKKYIVYKYGYKYYGKKKVKKRSYRFSNLQRNTKYTFAVRALNGKKHSAWKVITKKTGAGSSDSDTLIINGQAIKITEGKLTTLPLPSFPGVTINKKSIDIIPEKDDYYEFRDGIIEGKDPNGFYAYYNSSSSGLFIWSRFKYSVADGIDKYGKFSYNSKGINLPEEFRITINADNMKAVWTLDGTEPQYNQTDKSIPASQYPFGTWTKGGTVKVHGSATSSYSIPDVKWTDDYGYMVSRSAPIVVWAKLYQGSTLIEEDIVIDME